MRLPHNHAHRQGSACAAAQHLGLQGDARPVSSFLCSSPCMAKAFTPAVQSLQSSSYFDHCVTDTLLLPAPRPVLSSHTGAPGKGVTIAAGLFLGATLGIALFRTYQKYSSPRAQRMRVVSEPALVLLLGCVCVGGVYMGWGGAGQRVGGTAAAAVA